VNSVPEPSSVVMGAGGLVFLAVAVAWRRARGAQVRPQK
jgi:hypothetical protein